jgi:hypothetical protein
MDGGCLLAMVTRKLITFQFMSLLRTSVPTAFFQGRLAKMAYPSTIAGNKKGM